MASGPFVTGQSRDARSQRSPFRPRFLFARRLKEARRLFFRRISFTVRSGDVTRMHDDCQERFQHSIKVEREAADATERVSLVYKKRLDGR